MATIMLPVHLLVYTLTSIAVLFWQVSTVSTFLVPASARLAVATAVVILLIIGHANEALSLPAALVLGIITAIVSFLPTLGQFRWTGTTDSEVSAQASTASRRLMTLWHIWRRLSNHVSPGAAFVFIVVILAAVTATDSEPFSSGASSIELRLLSLIAFTIFAVPIVEAFQVQQHVRQLALERHTQARATTLQLDTRLALPLSGLHQRLWTLKTFSALQQSSRRCGHHFWGGACILLLQGAVGLGSWFRTQRQHLSATGQGLAQATWLGGAISAVAGVALLLLSTGQQELHLGHSAGHRVGYRSQVGLFITAATLWVLYALLHLQRCAMQASGPPASSLGGIERRTSNGTDGTLRPPKSSRCNTLFESTWPSSDHCGQPQPHKQSSPLQKSRLGSSAGGPKVDGVFEGNPTPDQHRSWSIMQSSIMSATKPHLARAVKAVSLLKHNGKAASAVAEGSEIQHISNLLQSGPQVQSCWKRIAGKAVIDLSMPSWLTELADLTLGAPLNTVDSLLEWTGCTDTRLMEFYRCVRAAMRVPILEGAQEVDGLRSEHLTLVTKQWKTHGLEEASAPLALQHLGLAADKV
jgi:hypothetical protein